MGARRRSRKVLIREARSFAAPIGVRSAGARFQASSSWHARMIRTATSPRFAIAIFSIRFTPMVRFLFQRTL